MRNFRTVRGLQRWAAIENLKIAATAATGKEAKQTVRKLKNRIKDLAEILKYAEQYKANRAYNIAYKILKTLKNISENMRA